MTCLPWLDTLTTGLPQPKSYGQMVRTKPKLAHLSKLPQHANSFASGFGWKEFAFSAPKSPRGDFSRKRDEAVTIS
ncbi:hypothetical protein TNCV_532971 [Trichonephila clavipes]|nr:hypothetical protein TNCV_532971 [Trichonephila clavipes]